MQELAKMFSGIITDVAKIDAIDKRNKDWLVTINCHLEMDEISIGDSIACDGICLTVVHKNNDSFAVEVSEATRQVSNVLKWQNGARINLEESLKIGDRMHGHFVLGHVDHCAKIINIQSLGGSHLLSVTLPEKLRKYAVEKGSIAINGISLTINETQHDVVSFNIIPHTWGSTNLSSLKVNDFVNVEVDYLAKIILHDRQN